MRYSLIAAVLMTVAGCGWGSKQEPVLRFSSDEIKVPKGTWVTVSPLPDSNVKTVTYVSLDGLAAFPSSNLTDQRKLVVQPNADGRFSFAAIGSLNDVSVRTDLTIIVGSVTPPTPTPTPVPPAPTPQPDPVPSDSLYPELQEAFNNDTTPKEAAAKLSDSKKLAAIYRGALKDGGIVETAKTIGELYKVMAEAAQSVVPDPKLKYTRTRIAKELSKELPSTQSAAITDEIRKKIETQFDRIAYLLENLR